MTVVPLSRLKRLRCSSCGATTEAACDCGASYVPAGELAARALADNPKASSASIAAQLGVGRATIDRARDSTCSNEQVETTTRIGRDGKERVPPQRQRPHDPHHFTPEQADVALRKTAGLLEGMVFDPPVGLRQDLVDAMPRAAPKVVKTLARAHAFLSDLLGVV